MPSRMLNDTVKPGPLYGHPLNLDNSLLQTVYFVPGKESPYIFSKFNLLNMDSLLILSFSMSLSVSVLREFDCSIIDFSLIYKPTFLRI